MMATWRLVSVSLETSYEGGLLDGSWENCMDNRICHLNVKQFVLWRNNGIASRLVAGLIKEKHALAARPVVDVMRF